MENMELLEKFTELSTLIALVMQTNNTLADTLNEYFGEKEEGKKPIMDYEKLRPIYEKIVKDYDDLASAIAVEADKVEDELEDLFHQDR